MYKKVFIAAGVVVLLGAALLFLLYNLKPEDAFLMVSGRVEAEEVELASRIPGRIQTVALQDGMEVKKGDLIAVIEDSELQSEKKEILHKIQEVRESIRSAELKLNYTKRDIAHGIDEAHKARVVAESRLKQAESKKENAHREFERYRNLLAKDAISKDAYDTVRLAYELADQELSIAQKELERANISLAKAEDTTLLIQAQERELMALKNSLDQFKENLNQMAIRIGYTRITAPSDGIILTRVAEPGEVLAAGGIIGIMIRPEDIHVKTYVPEKSVGSISLNMKVDVFADAFPERPFPGFVCHISDKAEFTPKEVQSYEERVKQVFAAKICFRHEGAADTGEDYQKVLKKGMPVDVRFPITP